MLPFLLTITKHIFLNNQNYYLNIINKYNIKDKQKILSIQGKSENHQYMRIILPKTAIIKPKE